MEKIFDPPQVYSTVDCEQFTEGEPHHHCSGCGECVDPDDHHSNPCAALNVALIDHPIYAPLRGEATETE